MQIRHHAMKHLPHTDQTILQNMIHATGIPKIAITGAKQIGKTSRALLWHQFLMQHGVPCAGFIELAVYQSDKTKIGYDYWAIHTNTVHSFARIHAHVKDLKLGDTHATFRPQGMFYTPDIWTWMLEQCCHVDAHMCWFWDEWGILEASGGGIYPIYRQISAQYQPRAHICLCRKDTLAQVEQILGGFDACMEITSPDDLSPLTLEI